MGTVYFVHCVDTEGPLYESLTATFDDMERVFGIRLEPTADNLAKVQAGVGMPEAQRAPMMARYAKARLNYNRDWAMIDRMHETLFSREFRESIVDDRGQSYALSWFCLDQVGFDENPRRRSLGYHVVFDYYADLSRRHPETRDELYWHFHPVAFNRRANCQGLSIQNHSLHLQSLSRRLLDREHFSAAFRPGYHQEKTDLNLFLEQWFPFDYANLNGADHQNQPRRAFRYIDWRHAPTEWRPYHPSFADAGTPGDLRRWVSRTLTLSTNFCSLTRDEMVKAFVDAEHRDVLVSVCSHDNRDMVEEIRELWALINDSRQVAKSRAELVFSTAVGGFVGALGLDRRPLEVDLTVTGDECVVQVRGDMFSLQPFLCFRTASGEYWHDNMSRGDTPQSFFYVFDEQTVPLRGIDKLGVAVTSPSGEVVMSFYQPLDGRTWSRRLCE